MDANKLANLMREAGKKNEDEEKMKMIAEHNRKLKLGSHALSNKEEERLKDNFSNPNGILLTPSHPIDCQRYQNFVYWFNHTNKYGMSLFINSSCSITKQDEDYFDHF